MSDLPDRSIPGRILHLIDNQIEDTTAVQNVTPELFEIHETITGMA
jgi:hypothetical protein